MAKIIGKVGVRLHLKLDWKRSFWDWQTTIGDHSSNNMFSSKSILEPVSVNWQLGIDSRIKRVEMEQFPLIRSHCNFGINSFSINKNYSGFIINIYVPINEPSTPVNVNKLLHFLYIHTHRINTNTKVCTSKPPSYSLQESMNSNFKCNVSNWGFSLPSWLALSMNVFFTKQTNWCVQVDCN